MKVSILTFIALYCIGTSAAFADGSRATSNKHGPAGIAVGEPLTLVSYAMAQAKLGEPVTLDELSGLLNKFRRFTGRAEGLSISSSVLQSDPPSPTSKQT